MYSFQLIGILIVKKLSGEKWRAKFSSGGEIFKKLITEILQLSNHQGTKA